MHAERIYVFLPSCIRNSTILFKIPRYTCLDIKIIHLALSVLHEQIRLRVLQTLIAAGIQDFYSGLSRRLVYTQ